MKKYLVSMSMVGRTLAGASAAIILLAGVAQASSTISTNISTDGTLSATGLSSFANASSTMLSVGSAYFGATATSTFDSAGNLAVIGTLGVTGATTLASTTATGMKVGQVGTRMTRIVSGYCVTGSTAISFGSNASTTLTYMECTPSGGTSILSTGDRVFVQATSSLPYHVVLQAASTTSGGLISVALANTSTSTATGAAVYAFNFWAFQ